MSLRKKLAQHKSAKKYAEKYIKFYEKLKNKNVTLFAIKNYF